ncbi:transmembrane family-2 glycosyl transferase, partial [Aquimarina celericrescens]|nr:transmembrane family-2 glycosyl transferase [Aquimarina celericrescens]
MKFIFFLFLISTLYILVQQFKIAFRLFKRHNSSSGRENQSMPVSIIICAKNEALNLSKNLLSVLKQDYN